MKKKFIFYFVFIITILISAVVFSQTRRSKEDEFTRAFLTVNENESISHTIRVCDADGDMVSITLENLPEGAVAGEVYEIFDYTPPDPNLCPDCLADSSWYALDIEWTPTYSQSGIHKIYIHAEDDQGGDDWVNYIITVNNVNRPPIL